MHRLRHISARLLKKKYFYRHKMKTTVKAILASGLILGTGVLTSCSSDSVGVDPDSAPPPTVFTGTFIDSAVANIAFRTQTRSGFTDDAGQFTFLGNETVTFSIGGIDFPSTKAKEVVTPMDIAGASDINDTMVLNIARLLLSLDVDGDPDNGIQISDDAHAQAQAQSLAFDSPTFEDDTINLVANSGSVTTTLVDEATAILHLEATFKSLPIADAGDPVTLEAAAEPVSTQLDGTGSYDPDGNDVTYSWVIVSQPECTIDGCPTASLVGPTLPNPTLTGMREPGLYVIGLTVNDGFFDSVNDATVTITLQKPLPASGGLLAAALLTTGLFGLYRRKKRTAA